MRDLTIDDRSQLLGWWKALRMDWMQIQWDVTCFRGWRTGGWGEPALALWVCLSKGRKFDVYFTFSGKPHLDVGLTLVYRRDFDVIVTSIRPSNWRQFEPSNWRQFDWYLMHFRRLIDVVGTHHLDVYLTLTHRRHFDVIVMSIRPSNKRQNLIKTQSNAWRILDV